LLTETLKYSIIMINWLGENLSFGISLSDFVFYDLNRKIRSPDPQAIFPKWQFDKETIAILSPHDDDAILGAGYMILYALVSGANVYVLIFCNGCYGYSKLELKNKIVEIRKQETINAYREIGLREENIIRFDYPDFSLRNFMGYILSNKEEGVLPKVIKELRRIKPTRLFVPNAYREHIDHEAVSYIGSYDGPQVGDPVVVDLGEPFKIISYLQYSVWSDFSPEDALVSNRSTLLRGSIVLAVTENVERKVRESIKKFESQQEILEYILSQRDGRKFRDRYLEVYLPYDPRPRLDYAPYKEAIASIDAKYNSEFLE